MGGFDAVAVVDWSARSRPSPEAPTADAIWIGWAEDEAVATAYRRTRAAAMADLAARLTAARAAGRRVLVGFDFPFGAPAGLAPRLTGQADALALWDWLAQEVRDGDDNANNRFDVAARINAACPGVGPFWGVPRGRSVAGVPARGSEREGHGLPERRRVEASVPRAHPVWKLYTTGSVGSQTLLGLPWLAALRRRFGADLTVWPFQAPEGGIVLAEVWPSLLSREVAAAAEPSVVRDRVQVEVLAAALARADAEGTLADLFAAAEGPDLAEEGWILGVGAEDVLRRAARAEAPPPLAPPPLRDDCFALPAGVDWTPVDEALALLRARLHPVVGTERLAVADADGRCLAGAVTAPRANPPAANSAVDGYGFAHAATGEGPQTLPLALGRAAAGAPLGAPLPPGQAVRILTGAVLPEGVDTVVLEEDCRTDGSRVAFRGPVRPGANTRRAGEDVDAGAEILAPGHRLRPPDLALLSAVGIAEVAVRARLRVGILSTGDELVPVGATTDPARTYDANRPMLLALAARWGHAPVDLGHVGDDRAALAARLDRARETADVVLTSGGASAGDEDHVSALLREAGAMQAWRIALKPGRPLALGLWRGMAVFGLPGNPVAALVCALIFARPALSRLAGGTWTAPQGFAVPAGFEKRKKPGRREYLRARIDADGRAEPFASEGSGRISGLSWAEGLVELPDGAVHVRPGDPVRFLPYAGFDV
ncbi:molybdopterin molybdenumtransferase MoeA [Rhodobacteraceae bacterium CCMM004]|nr:molybdopterin molybdenumtransferase MoeA [Rhodobacteraceae bacterium CCMM004]